MKKVFFVIAIAIIMIAGVTTYIVTTNSLEAEAADYFRDYTILVSRKTDYGYIPKYDFVVSKEKLREYIIIYYWEAKWLDDSDLLISFIGNEDVWNVKIAGNDPAIMMIKEVEQDFGLHCHIPIQPNI